MNAYCQPCGPGPCAGECLEEAGSCDTCFRAFESRDDYDAASECWACNTRTCTMCLDALGWPCEHFSERLD